MSDSGEVGRPSGHNNHGEMWVLSSAKFLCTFEINEIVICIVGLSLKSLTGREKHYKI